ncbi:MAG: hypothetical protein ABEJ55_01140 [Halanaeroarchaeum sp.]
MGKTRRTHRQLIEELAQEDWKPYRRTLRLREQPYYDDLWEVARKHADATKAANPRPIEGALFSMALELLIELQETENELDEVRSEVERLRNGVGVNAGRISSLEPDSEVVSFEGEYDDPHLEAAQDDSPD